MEMVLIALWTITAIIGLIPIIYVIIKFLEVYIEINPINALCIIISIIGLIVIIYQIIEITR
jgi:hypothetical protein